MIRSGQIRYKLPVCTTLTLIIHSSKLHNHDRDKFWLILHNARASTVERAETVISICCRKAYDVTDWYVDANCQNVPLLITVFRQYFAWIDVYMFWPIVSCCQVAISGTLKLYFPCVVRFFCCVCVNNEYTLMSTVRLPTCINIVHKITILHLTQQFIYQMLAFHKTTYAMFSLRSVHLLSQPWFAFVLDLTWNTPRSRTPVILQMIQMSIIMGGMFCAKSVEMGGIWYHHRSPII